GFLADKIGGIRTLLIGSVAQGFALLFYLFFDSLSSLYVISAMFGLFQGGIVPSYAIIVREAMPAREAATRVGIVIFASVFGMSFGGWVSGVIFDASGVRSDGARSPMGKPALARKFRLFRESCNLSGERSSLRKFSADRDLVGCGQRSQRQVDWSVRCPFGLPPGYGV